MNENEFIDWQDANWNELVKEFVETQIDLFHKYCVEEYNNYVNSGGYEE